jgi:hypothetical protein
VVHREEHAPDKCTPLVESDELVSTLIIQLIAHQPIPVGLFE